MFNWQPDWRPGSNFFEGINLDRQAGQGLPIFQGSAAQAIFVRHAGQEDTPSFSLYHQVFNRARWSALKGSRCLHRRHWSDAGADALQARSLSRPRSRQRRRHAVAAPPRSRRHRCCRRRRRRQSFCPPHQPRARAPRNGRVRRLQISSGTPCGVASLLPLR